MNASYLVNERGEIGNRMNGKEQKVNCREQPGLRTNARIWVARHAV